MGLVFAVASLLIVVQLSSPKQASAQSTPDILGNCVDLVVGKLGNSTWCKFLDNPEEYCGANQLYGKGAFENAFAKQQAKYQAAYSADGYSKPPPPGSVTILDSNNKPISGPSNALTFSRFSYRGQSYTSKAQNVVYFVYDSTYDSSFKLLLTLRPSGNAPLIIGLVNTGNNLKGGKVPVCAYNINKNAILSTATGAPVETGDTEGEGGEADACQKNSGGWAFTWAVCPVLNAADELTTFLVNNFEEQLAFNVSQLGSTSDPKSGSYKIHQTWSLIKNIASALVVIVMLIMVLSQAISVGPFDAYTVRKLLPRLVAVVILMQISWPLFTYVIDIVNNLGRGIADIMYLPFGGADNMDLWSLLNNAKLGDGTLAAMNWGGLVVFGILGVAFLFTMLGLAFMAIIALLFAVITLIFRKILIITLLIFAPLALLAWTLPGTEKYWKLWRENFLKVLMMFPIIMAIIAAGRIFAYVVGTPDTNKFMALLFILVGFFGPLFLLPRTFKWGGQAMNLAGDRIMGVGKTMGERQKKFFGARQEEYNRQKNISAAQRLSNWEQGRLNTRQKIGSIIRGDKFKSGEWDPTYAATPVGRREMMRQRREKMAKFRAAAPRAEQEEIGDEFEKLKQRVSNVTEAERGQIVRNIIANRGNRHSNTEVQAALKQALSDRDYATVEAWVNRNASTQEGREQNNIFRTLNAGELSATVPHLLKGDYGADGLHMGIVRAAGSSQGEVAVYHGRTVESIVSHLSQQAEHGTTQEVRNEARGALNGFLRTYAAASQNPDVMGSINRQGAEVVRQFLDSNSPVEAYSERTNAASIIPAIDTGPSERVKQQIIRDPNLRDTVSTIERNIQPGGVVALADVSGASVSPNPESIAEAAARGAAQAMSQNRTFRPTAGVSTGNFQGEINIQQPNQGGTPSTGGSPEGTQNNNPPGSEGPRETQNYTDFTNEDFGPNGRFPPPNIPPPSDIPPGPNNP